MNNFLQKFKDNYYLITPFLIFLSFPSYDFWFLQGFAFYAWLAFIPLFLFIKNKSLKKVYWVSFLTGLISNYLRFYWIGYFAAEVSGGFYILILILIPLISVIFAIKILLAEYLSRKFEFFRVLIYPSVWIIIDWFMTLGFLAFPFNYLGHSQFKFTSFIQLASFVGILGVNFIIILFNCLLADLIHLKIKTKFKIRSKAFIFSGASLKFFSLLIFIFLFSLYGFYQLKKTNKVQGGSKDLRVSVVQSCISPWDNWIENRFQHLGDLKKYTEMSLTKNPDFIIWSESATLEALSFNYFNNRSNSFGEELFSFIKEIKKPLFTGEIGITEIRENLIPKRYPQNNVALINGSGEIVKTYPKIILVPFGEWFPYVNWFPSLKDFIVRCGGSDFIPGKKQEVFTLDVGQDKKYKFAGLICYEATFPQFCRQYLKQGIDFFINSSNDGWTDTFNGHTQHFAASIFRAIENGRWLIRAGNTGVTATIDPYGRIKKSIPILKPGYLVDDLDFSLNHQTFYSQYGDLTLYLSFIFIGSLVVVLFFPFDFFKKLFFALS